MMRYAITVALAALALPATADEAPDLGTVLLFGGAPRVEFQTPGAARAGAVLTLILPDLSTPGDLRITTTTVGPALEGAADEGRAAFALPAMPDAPAIGFAVMGPSPDVSVTGGVLRLDVTGDGVAETLSACLTMEAVQLRAVNDAGEEVWQDYVPLGYDVEATCP